ncbi:MAG: hypothetical protein V4805_11610 [Pseudomonadota bacterium]
MRPPKSTGRDLQLRPKNSRYCILRLGASSLNLLGDRHGNAKAHRRWDD